MAQVSLQVLGDGLVGSLAQLAGIAASLLLVLMVLALGTYAYKQLRGDGVRWPDEDDPNEDGVHRGAADDEWDYY